MGFITSFPKNIVKEGLTPEKEHEANELLRGTPLDGMDFKELASADTLKKRMKWVYLNGPGTSLLGL